jgi:hypothetical protein
MPLRPAPSRPLALLFVLALGAVLGGVLGAPSARVPLRKPFVSRAERAAPVSLSLEARESRRGGRVYRLALRARSAAEVLAHEELQLFLESEAPLALARAALELRGGACVLAAPGRDSLADRQPTVFRRSTGCSLPQSASGPVDIDLVVEADGQGNVTLLGFLPQVGADPGPLRATATSIRPHAIDIRGAFVDYPETAPRIVLLAHMWRLAPDVGWLAAGVGAAILLACAGCLVFPTRAIGATAAAPPAATILRGAAGAFLCAASLTLLHTLLDPPLSGPDEPYHLLGFADLAKDEALAKDVVAWMGETHLWRIRQQPAERFRTIDVGVPYVVEDDQLRATEVAMRSAVLVRLWRAAAPLLRGESAPRVLLELRLLNALLFSLAVGTAAALAMALVREPYPQWLTYVFLFVPALPFFAMHVSETAVLCSIYVLFGTSLAVISLDGPRVHWAGLPLGVATGLMLAGGRSPWPLSVIVGAALAGRIALGPSRRAPRAAIVFWGGFGAGAALFFLLLDEAYRLMTETYAMRFARLVPGGLSGVGVWLLAHPAGALAVPLCGAALEAALGPARSVLAARLAPGARPILAWTARLLALAVVLSLLGSLVFSYPQLPLEPAHPLTAAERVRAVLQTTATMFRLAEPSFLLASSFWVGFGWLDTIPGPAFQGLLVALVAAALTKLLLEIARHAQVRRFLWLLLLGSGAIAAIVLYTLSTQGMVAALQGRYLIGWYLAVLPVIGAVLVLDPGNPTSGATEGKRAALLLALAGGIHVYCLSFVLKRYF